MRQQVPKRSTAQEPAPHTRLCDFGMCVDRLPTQHEQASYRSLADGGGAGPSLHLLVVLRGTNGRLDITNVS